MKLDTYKIKIVVIITNNGFVFIRDTKVSTYQKYLICKHINKLVFGVDIGAIELWIQNFFIERGNARTGFSKRHMKIGSI
jgi:hypothetical protein